MKQKLTILAAALAIVLAAQAETLTLIQPRAYILKVVEKLWLSEPITKFT